jgi:hypothetical protein
MCGTGKPLGPGTHQTGSRLPRPVCLTHICHPWSSTAGAGLTARVVQGPGRDRWRSGIVWHAGLVLLLRAIADRTGLTAGSSAHWPGGERPRHPMPGALAVKVGRPLTGPPPSSASAASASCRRAKPSGRRSRGTASRSEPFCAELQSAGGTDGRGGVHDALQIAPGHGQERPGSRLRANVWEQALPDGTNQAAAKRKRCYYGAWHEGLGHLVQAL